MLLKTRYVMLGDGLPHKSNILHPINQSLSDDHDDDDGDDDDGAI